MTDEPARFPRRIRARSWAAPGLVGLALVLTWRATTLSGLPDIGDPFDVAAYEAFSVPDDRNAFALYRLATPKLPDEPTEGGYDWATTTEAKRRWLMDHREALELWRRGSERPEALYTPPKDLTFATMLPVIQDLRKFARMAQLESSRLQAEGDFAGALDFELAMLRSGKHCGHRGFPIERMVGSAIYSVGCSHLNHWATNPGLDPKLIRRAIDGVLAAEALTPKTSDVLKTEYVCFLHSLRDRDLLQIKWTGGDLPRAYRWPGGRFLLEDLNPIVKREPERTRRVVRLMFANWLAVADLPVDRRPPRAATPPKKSGNYLLHNDLLPQLFLLDDRAPTSARAIPPADLARWWDSTIYARRFTPSLQTLIDIEARDRVGQANLVIALANKLYRRDHGVNPEKAEELVGPYLKALPEGYVPAP